MSNAPRRIQVTVLNCAEGMEQLDDIFAMPVW
jgi:hypothetical protein